MSMTTSLMIIIIICILLSMYFSATETAFNAVSRIRLKSKAEWTATKSPTGPETAR